ncbi:mechanosensitive ion channel family protein [Paraconexibacter antarcticus]|uniref:Mechanosensitive ion channel family protein n=1 Tax=Paraconexibacter antarcticus TaxID=2949664 RepID=A0ABY5E0N1_9ACTN|nr:mechanosensitive ion channel family protein [Paraconexibacter antarcticus]UTI66390.1 mechanosensitive ion channel family protein [Paraconexibacter antarcticus]
MALSSFLALPALADVSTHRMTSVCGSSPHFWCRTLLNATDNRTLSTLSDTFIGVPLRIAGILLIAFVANRLARRGVRTLLSHLQPGALALPETVRRRRRARQDEHGAARARPMSNVLASTGENSLRGEQRMDALSGVLRSIVSFVIGLIAGFMILGAVGIDLRPLLAGAGILGLAVGFGAQSLVKDFLSGVFILVEDQFGVGDIVQIDADASGTVELVSLRTTRLRAVDGTVWHVPNGQINKVGNKSQLWSRSLLDVEVAYDTDLEHAKQVIQDTADIVWKEHDSVLEQPDLWGVEALGANGVTIRLVVKTTPAEQWRVSRLLRERIKAAFDEAGIEIPFPQQTVWHRPAEERAA